MPDIFDTLAPEDQATDQSFAEPTPSGDIFDQIAPEGGGQTGDIFDQISPEPVSGTPLTDKALSATEQFTGTPAELAALKTEPKPQIASAFGRGAERALESVVPSSLSGVGKMAAETVAGMVVPITMEDVRTAQNIGKVAGGAPIEETFQEKPFTQYNTEDWVALGGSIGAQALMAIPLFRGLRPQVRNHILNEAARGEPTGIEAEVGRPPTGYVGPGTVAEDVGRAMERRFTTVEPPPEAAPELAAAPTVEEGLAATAPRVSPEGGEYFPEAGIGGAPEVSPVSETARIGGERYAIKPSTTQVEGGPTALGVQEGAGSEVTGAGRSDYAEREAQRAEAGGAVPQEAVEPPAAGAQLVIPEAARPVLTEATRSGSTIRLAFDATGKIPTEAELKSMFGENVMVSPIQPGITAGTKGIVQFRLDATDASGRMSSTAAEQAYNRAIGTSESIRTESAFQRAGPLSKRFAFGKRVAGAEAERPFVEAATGEQMGGVPADRPAAAGAQPPPVQTGISQARTEAELGPGSVEPGVGAEMGSGIAFGREYINKGGDPRLPIRRANTSGLVGKNEVGIVHAELERLRGERNAAAQLLEANPDNPTVRAAFDVADAAQRAWRKELQPVLTKASDALKEAHAQSMPDADPATYQGLADLMDEHFKGQREVTPEMRTKMAKAAKGVKEVRDIANGEMKKVEDTLTRKLPKGKKVMTPEELDADLRSELENQFKDCVLGA